MAALRTINLEAGFPTVEEARKQLAAALKQAARDRVSVLKVIHGYGSSGKGGALQVGLRKSLRLRKKEGVIKAFIPGEDFSIFRPETLELLASFPELRGDPDLNQVNEGLTVIWVR